MSTPPLKDSEILERINRLSRGLVGIGQGPTTIRRIQIQRRGDFVVVTSVDDDEESVVLEAPEAASAGSAK